jgi:hypothetical protein
MTTPSEILEIDRWVPNYKVPCQNCGQTPTVTAVKNDMVVYDNQLCGPCTWGNAETLDPEKW